MRSSPLSNFDDRRLTRLSGARADIAPRALSRSPRELAAADVEDSWGIKMLVSLLVLAAGLAVNAVHPQDVAGSLTMTLIGDLGRFAGDQLRFVGDLHLEPALAVAIAALAVAIANLAVGVAQLVVTIRK